MRVRALVLLSMSVAVSAAAEPSAHSTRLFATYGGASRNAGFYRDTVTLGGTSISDVHLSLAHFFTPGFGVELEGRGELFYAKASSSNYVAQPSFDLAPMVAGRLQPARWLSLEAHLGWGFSQRSAVDAQGAAHSGFFTGPTLQVAVGLMPLRSLSGLVYARLQPFNLVLDARSFNVGLQASLGSFHVGAAQLGVAATLEWQTTNVTNVGTGTALRFGVGLSVLRWVDEPSTSKPVVSQVPPLRGRVVNVQGTAVSGALVLLDDVARVTSDASGGFTFAAVAAGSHVISAQLEGQTPGSLEVTAPMNTVVELKLGPPTGPGRIVGVVSAGGAPLVNAQVLAVETGVSAKSDAQGRYVLAKVGPGPVTVQVTAEGFANAEEVAQVAPGGEATLEVVLVPKTAVLRATLRGLVRARTGEALKGTVRVVELKLKLEVKADGRFSAEVPSGKYTLIIQSPGFVTQTHVVEVSGGDQAIFHAELERLR